MSLSTLAAPPGSAAGPVRTNPLDVARRMPVAVTLGCLLALALSLAKALAVWRTGIFFDPDDAMRAVQVRDFIGGQGWFDLVPHRLSPDQPFVMHWSRLVDLPLAAGTRALEAVVSAEMAERLVRLAEPVLLYAVFITAMATLARRLIGRSGALAAALICGGGLETVGDFVPGHIHHHALQVTLLALLVKAVVDSGDPGGARRAGWAGAVAALTLAVNLQNMPFVGVAAGALTLLWVRHGEERRPALVYFASGLMAGTGAIFLLQVPPGHYAAGTCDAFAAPHVLAAWVGGAGLLLLGAVSSRLAGPRVRLAAAALAGAATLLAVKLAYPACLGDPYAGVDPLLRERWLSEVGEAMPLWKLLVSDPGGTLPIALAILCGAGATVAALARARGAARERWIVVAAFGFVAVLGSFWQVRVAGSAEALGALGGAWLLCRWFDAGIPRRFGALACVLCGLGLTEAGWAAVIPEALFGPKGVASKSRGFPPIDANACYEPALFDRLRAAPPGLVLSGIDEGSHILAHTPLSVLAAPYHRNAAGNRVALLAFAAPPEEARRLIEQARARYVVLCTTSAEIQQFAIRTPDGLAALIMTGRVPAWLRDTGLGSGPLRVYEMRPAEG